MGSRSAWRAVGAAEAPYPSWLRDLSDCSGVYAIRLAGGRVLYVGESHKGNLKKNDRATLSTLVALRPGLAQGGSAGVAVRVGRRSRADVSAGRVRSVLPGHTQGEGQVRAGDRASIRVDSAHEAAR